MIVDPEQAREQREEMRQRRADPAVDVAVRRRWLALARTDGYSFEQIAELDGEPVWRIRDAVRLQLELDERPAAEVDRVLGRTEEAR